MENPPEPSLEWTPSVLVPLTPGETTLEDGTRIIVLETEEPLPRVLPPWELPLPSPATLVRLLRRFIGFVATVASLWSDITTMLLFMYFVLVTLLLISTIKMGRCTCDE